MNDSPTALGIIMAARNAAREAAHAAEQEAAALQRRKQEFLAGFRREISDNCNALLGRMLGFDVQQFPDLTWAVPQLTSADDVIEQTQEVDDDGAVTRRPGGVELVVKPTLAPLTPMTMFDRIPLVARVGVGSEITSLSVFRATGNDFPPVSQEFTDQLSFGRALEQLYPEDQSEPSDEQLPSFDDPWESPTPQLRDHW